MNTLDVLDFEIDVDLSNIVGAGLDNILVSAEYYEQALPRADRGEDEQAELDRLLRNQIWRSQWRAAARARSERRESRRAPLLRTLWVDGRRADTYVCDISRDGLRASGRPPNGTFDVSLKVPGMNFPVETRAEVVDFRDANVLPLMNIRFVGLHRRIADKIDGYVHDRLMR